LEGAQIALERGSYDSACFLSEQALQLYLKYVLLVIVGDYPRTHGVRRLLGEVAKILGSKELEDFIKANRVRLIALEDSYIMARYFISEYSKEDAEDVVKVVKETMSLVKLVGGKA
jgi:HEPN domain-containing protein